MWYYGPLNRLAARITRRLMIALAIGVFIVVCFVCPTVFGVADLAVRQIGLLPTYTPRPPATPTAPPSPTRGERGDSLRLREVLEACQLCQREALAALGSPADVRLPDCLDAHLEMPAGDSTRLVITSDVNARRSQAVRCDLTRGDGEWRVDGLWLRSDGVWRSQDSRRGD
jgi:hypothetical protein